MYGRAARREMEKFGGGRENVGGKMATETIKGDHHKINDD
jgi:hypothetical protein